MTLTLDANILVYAANTADSYHVSAVAAIRRLANDREPVLLFAPAVLAYLRVTTHPRLLARPLSLDDALLAIDRLLRLPHVRLASSAARWSVLQDVLTESGARGKLVHDAELVALMREHAVDTIWTRDTDFHRFTGIRVVNPL